MGTTLLDLARERILSQFQQSPNLGYLVDGIYREIDNLYDLLVSLRDYRDLDTAEGVSLDFIGDVIGVKRQYLEESSANIFTFKISGEASNPDMGFLEAGPPIRGGRLQSTTGITTLIPTLDSDDNYRKQIRATAMANNMSGTIPEIYTYILNGFNVVCSITSEQTGEILISIEGPLTQRERYTIANLGPIQAGCRVEFTNWIFVD
jgi:hypothetical protein